MNGPEFSSQNHTFVRSGWLRLFRFSSVKTSHHLTAIGVINAFMAATLIAQTLAAVRAHDQERLQFLKWRLWPTFALLFAVQALVTWGPHLGR